MSETIIDDPSNTAADRDDKLLAAINYGLILLGNIIGVTTIIALIIAYARKDKAPNWLYSHYVYQIRTFWYALAGIVAAVALTITIIGIPFAMLLGALIWLWILIRSLVGLIRLLDGRGQASANGYWV